METLGEIGANRLKAYFSILWWIGVMETAVVDESGTVGRYFSILWWIGVMETIAS